MIRSDPINHYVGQQEIIKKRGDFVEGILNSTPQAHQNLIFNHKNKNFTAPIQSPTA